MIRITKQIHALKLVSTSKKDIIKTYEFYSKQLYLERGFLQVIKWTCERPMMPQAIIAVCLL